MHTDCSQEGITDGQLRKETERREDNSTGMSLATVITSFRLTLLVMSEPEEGYKIPTRLMMEVSLLQRSHRLQKHNFFSAHNSCHHKHSLQPVTAQRLKKDCFLPGTWSGRKEGRMIFRFKFQVLRNQEKL